MTLVEFRAALSLVPADAFKSAVLFPTNWKSMTSGNRYKVRKDPDVVYVERILSDAEREIGDFTGMELHKGKQGYAGNEHFVVAGSSSIVGPIDRWRTDALLTTRLRFRS
jgi:hypothetical protein